MELATWAVNPSQPVVATAIHNGHDLRPDIAETIAVDEPTRFREEDPWTGEIAAGVGSHIAVHRSRFEVDLNRDREMSFYMRPEDAWGLDLWRTEPDPRVAEESRRLHDGFYQRLAGVLDDLVTRHGGFVLYDVHSYNHRRDGPDADPGPVIDNPMVNLGTGSLSAKWQPVAEQFIASVGKTRPDGEALDTRAKVRFEGGYLSAWVNDEYSNVGCALAIEFKKTYMDEWTSTVDPAPVHQLADALADSVSVVWEAHQRCR